MEYTKPELVLTGQAESLVLGHTGHPRSDPGGSPADPSLNSALEFED